MSRTLRRRTKDATTTSATKSHPDWSCGNPMCCGGLLRAKERRQERARTKAQLKQAEQNGTTDDFAAQPPKNNRGWFG